MSPLKKAVTIPEIYDQALVYARDRKLPPDAPRPHPTRDWPPENIALLERYRDWLESGGASAFTIRLIYIAMAGHVLGLNLKPASQLNLETDLPKAMAYVYAKQLSAEWTDINRNALDKFHTFLLQERGLSHSKITPYDPAPHTQGLPGWLVKELTRYQHIKQRNWRQSRLEEGIRRFWSGHLRLWRYLVEQCGVKELSDLKRPMVYDYIDQRLKEGHSAKGVNGDLRGLHGFLGFLQDQDYPVTQALLRMPCLKEPDPLPRFLTDEQVRALRDDFEKRAVMECLAHQHRDAILDRAAFYLLWQGGLRRAELEELRLEDLDLGGKRLMVRKGKGLSDRTVFLTATTVQAVRAYLEVRGQGPSDHVFLYRNQPLSKDLVHGRLKLAGERVGVHVYAHRLRHTCATQLLNAGCRITSIQKILGHRRLNTTLTYARVYDQTVAEDYYTAMERVEQRLDLVSNLADGSEPVSEEQHDELETLAGQLVAASLSRQGLLEIVSRLRLMVFEPVGTPGSTALVEAGAFSTEYPP